MLHTVDATTTRMQPAHDGLDENRIEALTDSMRTSGWQGAPLVRWGEYDLVTGAHRWRAAQAAELAAVPVVDLEDVYREEGLDFAALHAAHGNPTLYEPDMVDLLGELPVSAREAYGIDMH